MYSIKTFYGFDSHVLLPGLPLIIGGVKIFYNYGLLGHSDSDILIHAIIDSILNVSNFHNIGSAFPDKLKKYQGINSRIILRKTERIIRDLGWRLLNLNATILIQKPKIELYINEIINNVSLDLNISKKDINLKFKTSEETGCVGREECISVNLILSVFKI